MDLPKEYFPNKICSLKFAMKNTTMQFDEIKSLYDTLDIKIYKMFGEICFLYEQRCSNKTIITSAIDTMLLNHMLFDEIFLDMLNFIGMKKIKCVSKNNICHDSLFKNSEYQIINFLCNDCSKLRKKKEYYKYNMFAFYIIVSNLIKKSVGKFNKVSQIHFFHEMYSNITYLLSLYVTNILPQMFPGSDFSIFPKVINSENRDRIDIQLGIRNLLYTGTVLETPTADKQNIAIFAIRGFIETWLRANFHCYIYNNEYIPISILFSALTKLKDEIKRDKSLRYNKNIDKDIVALSTINKWCNRCIHTVSKPFFWAPYFIEMYLSQFLGRCRDSYCKQSGQLSLYQPLILKDSKIYTKISNEIENSLFNKTIFNKTIWELP